MTHTCSPSPARPHGVAIGKALLASLGLVLLTLTGPAHGQFLLSETTWGGTGAEVATAVATAPDGSAYLVGSTDSFAFDQFGQPATRMFIVKLSNGAVVWQRIWNGPTIVGVTDASVAVAADGSAYVAGITADGGGDAVLLKFDPNGNLLWERAWGGTESDSAGAVATHSDGSVYVAGRTTSFGPSSAGVFVLKFDSAGQPSLATALGRCRRLRGDGRHAGRQYLRGQFETAAQQQFFPVRRDGAEAGASGHSGLGTDVRGRRGRGCARRNGRRRGWVHIHRWRHPGGERRHRRHRRAGAEDRGRWQLVVRQGMLHQGRRHRRRHRGGARRLGSARRNDNGVGRRLPGCVRRAPGVDRQEGDSRGHLGWHRLRDRWRGRGCARQHGAACSHDEPWARRIRCWRRSSNCPRRNSPLRLLRARSWIRQARFRFPSTGRPSRPAARPTAETSRRPLLGSRCRNRSTSQRVGYRLSVAGPCSNKSVSGASAAPYSTVTLLARLRGLSTSVPRAHAV